MADAWENIKVENSNMRAYVATPATADRVPGIVVVQGQTGVNDMVEFSRLAASEGFVAAAPGCLPVSVQATGVARAESELTAFTLQPSLVISGSLLLPDGKPVTGASVLATPIWAETDVTLGKRWFAYRAGQIFPCPAADGAPDGVFRIDALVPGDYDLTVAARGFAPDLLATARRRASPPQEKVALVLTAAMAVGSVAGPRAHGPPRRDGSPHGRTAHA